MRFGNLDHNFELKKRESGLYFPSIQIIEKKKRIFIPEVVSETVIVGDNNKIFLIKNDLRRSVTIKFFLE